MRIAGELLQKFPHAPSKLSNKNTRMEFLTH